MTSLSSPTIIPKPWESSTKINESPATLKSMNNPPAISSNINAVIFDSNMNNTSDDSHQDHVSIPPQRPQSLNNFVQNSQTPIPNNGQQYINMDGINSAYNNLNQPSMFGNNYNMPLYSDVGGMYRNPHGSLYNSNSNAYGMQGVGSPNNITNSTQATFQLIESLIGAVTGFAQILESTYMATHNSFFTLMSIAEQFSYLKQMLGSAIGIFSIMRYLKKALFYVTNGKLGLTPRQIDGRSGSSSMIIEFEQFRSNNKVFKGKKIAWKLLLFFLVSVFGFPYVLNKFILRLQLLESSKRVDHPIDFSKLEFAKALYDFVPENPQIELALKKGDLMAIISKADLSGNDSEWWKVRTKSGGIGFVPYNYLEIIPRKKNQLEIIP